MKNSNRQRVCFDDNITVMCDYKSSERKFLSINERNLYPYNNSNSFPSWTSQKSLKSRSTVGSSFIGRRNRPKSPAIDYPQTDFFQSNKFIPISSVRGFAELNPAFIDDLNNIRPAGEEIHLAIQPGPNWTNRFTPYNRTLDEILDSRPYQVNSESDISRQLAVYRLKDQKAKRRRLWIKLSLVTFTFVFLSVGIGLTVYYD